MKIVLLIPFVVALCSAYPFDEIVLPKQQSSTRNIDFLLQEDIVPEHYTIEITPYLADEGTNKQFTFDGKTTILFTNTIARTTLKVNAKRLNNMVINLVNLDDPAIQVPVTGIAEDIEKEMLTLTFTAALVVDKKYELQFEYTGEMDVDMAGFYVSEYKENGKTVYLGATQMQATSARRVFPGFDEPKYKATFGITIFAPAEYTAISNTKIQGAPIAEGNRMKYTFENTPKMSTYLVAFMVSKFTENVEGTFGVWARPEQYNQTQYALEIGQELLKWFDDWIGIKYLDTDGIEKMDMAALPDFAAGAMENWGLLTYREQYLLNDADYTTDQAQQTIATIIAHEQAHQWFGDLVTCEWWDNTWLHEGFATYFEYFATVGVLPGWELEKQFVVDQVQRALNYDSLSGSHPMTHEVFTPDEVSGIFDLITYQKSGAVIRMLEHMLTPTVFQNVLREYITSNAHGNTVAKNLLDAIDKVEGSTTKSGYFKKWIENEGYPLVTVDLDATDKILTFTQKHFSLVKPNPDRLWPIPLTFASKASQDPGLITYMSLRELKITSDEAADLSSWSIVNVKQSGFYRVNYNAKLWGLISTALKAKDHDEINELNRAQIVDDLFNLGRASELDYNFAFQILEYLKTETNYLPWVPAFNGFSFLASRMSGSNLNLLKRLVRDFTNNVYKYVDVDYDQAKRLETYNRVNVMNWACKVGNPDCISKSSGLFKEFHEKGTEIEVNIRGPVLCTAMRNANEEEYKFLWERFVEEQIQTEKILLLRSMACLSNTTLLSTFLDQVFDVEVRLQDKRSIFTAAVTSTEENLDAILDYVMEKYQAMLVSLNNQKSEIISIFSLIAGRFTSEAQITKLDAFLKETTNTAFFGEALKSSIESATANLAWNKEKVPVIVNYMDNYFGSAASITVSLTLMLAAVAFALVRN